MPNWHKNTFFSRFFDNRALQNETLLLKFFIITFIFFCYKQNEKVLIIRELAFFKIIKSFTFCLYALLNNYSMLYFCHVESTKAYDMF